MALYERLEQRYTGRFALGEKDLAIEQYRRVLTMLPTHTGTKRRLEALTGKAP